MSAWTWRLESLDGREVEVTDLAGLSFPSQAEAESWVGESWHDLLERGVDQVSLFEDGNTVYGPMSLRPAG